MSTCDSDSELSPPSLNASCDDSNANAGVNNNNTNNNNNNNAL
jgi:hypothetical protein